MAKVIPFKGLRYNPDKIGDIAKVVAPPYDIISPAQQEDLYNSSEYNVIRLEYGREYDGDNEKNNKYTRAGAALREWVDNQVLRFDDAPSFYIYEQEFCMQENVPKILKGIVSLVELEEFAKGVVLPHEETLSKAKTDRFNLMSATDSNFSQIYSLYMDDSGRLAEIIKSQSAREPDVSFTAWDGILQRLWVVDDTGVNAEISKLFEDKQLFIADGHHRYETALNYRNKKREMNPLHSGDELYNYVMMMLVNMEDEGLVVFPTHRLVKDLNDFDETNLISCLTDNFNVSKIHFTDNKHTEIIGERMGKILDEKVFSLYTGKEYYYILELKDLSIMDDIFPDKSEAYRHLDVTILHELILNQLLGIDEENMAQQRNLTYTRDINEAVVDVKKMKYQCSFIINATKVSEIKEVSLANEKMPQKSTYFYPKLVTGIVMNKFGG